MALSGAAAELASFELLLTVARAGSIGQAAKEHGLSQPAASIRLRQLESRLGVTLLERSAYGTRLSAAGELVASWARPVLARAAELDEALHALRAGTGRRARLRIAATPLVAEGPLPRWLVVLNARETGGDVALTTGTPAEVAARVLGKRAELGFVETSAVPEGLQTRVVAHDEAVLVVAPTHRWARRRTALTATEVRQALADAPEGRSPALLSSRAVEAELATGELVRVRLPAGIDPVRRLRAVWIRGAELSADAAALIHTAVRLG